MLQQARASGNLNLSNRGLGPTLPREVCLLHDQSMLVEDERFWENVDLRTLDVSLNDLESLPEELAEFAELTKLVARNNRIHTLPQTLSGLATLTVLDLSNNQIPMLPPDFGALVSLSDVCLEGNGYVVPPLDPSRMLAALSKAALTVPPFISRPAGAA